jgi:hypothetical protein
MGFDLARQLQSEITEFYGFVLGPKRAVQRASLEEGPWLAGTTTTLHDARHVVLVRNVYDAIASGYLYHKAGHECHRHPHNASRPWPAGWPKIENLHRFWEYTTTVKDEQIVPAHAQRSLCTYLASETMRDGLRVYMDWAFSVYYQSVEQVMDVAPITAWQTTTTKSKNDTSEVDDNPAAAVSNMLHKNTVSKRNELVLTYPHPPKHDPTRSTIFVCMEDLTHHERDQTTVQDIMLHLFPNLNIPYGGWRPGAQIYTGGHSTSHDPSLRHTLRKLTMELDTTDFGGRVATLQALLRCGES